MSKRPIPFSKRYPLAKEEAMELLFQYQYSKEREKGDTFRTFLVKKIGKKK